jgi:hypothetical protein
MPVMPRYTPVWNPDLSAGNVSKALVIRGIARCDDDETYRIDAVFDGRHIAVLGLLSGRQTLIDWHRLGRYTIMRPA